LNFKSLFRLRGHKNNYIPKGRDKLPKTKNKNQPPRSRWWGEGKKTLKTPRKGTLQRTNGGQVVTIPKKRMKN
jgi:hypothetical protein